MSFSPLFPTRMPSLSRRGSNVSTNSTGSDTPRASPHDNVPSPRHPLMSIPMFSRRHSDASISSDTPGDQRSGSPSSPRPSLISIRSLSHRGISASAGSDTPCSSPYGSLGDYIFDDFNRKVRSRQKQDEEREDLLRKTWWRCCQCSHRLYFGKGVTEHNPLTGTRCTGECGHYLCQLCEIDGEAFTKLDDLQTVIDVDISGRAQKKYGWCCHRCGHSWYVQLTQQTIRKASQSGFKRLSSSDKWEILWSKQPCINCEALGHHTRCSIKCLKFRSSDRIIDLTAFITSSKADTVLGIDSSDVRLNTPKSPSPSKPIRPKELSFLPSPQPGFHSFGFPNQEPDLFLYQRQVDHSYRPPLFPNTQLPCSPYAPPLNTQPSRSVNQPVQKANWSHNAFFNRKPTVSTGTKPDYSGLHQAMERAAQVIQDGNSRLNYGRRYAWNSAQVQRIWQDPPKPHR